MRKLVPLMAALLLCCFAMPAFSQSIFIWDRDLGDTFNDPLGAGNVSCEFAVERSLTNLGYTHTTATALPADLSPYDLVFIVGGVYC